MPKTLDVLDNETVDAEMSVFQEAVLDRDGLDCLLADIDDLADIVEIRIKTASPRAQSQTSTDLLSARSLFLEGRAAALQIIYRFADGTWCDTLLSDGENTRLMRLAEPMRADTQPPP